MDRPIVSIIIPAYNAEKYINDCIASIQSQIYSDYEVIIVDDGSKDATAQICDELVSNDRRVRVFHLPNGGAGAARKFGVSMAHGDWVMFVDCDDTLTKNGLSLMVEFTNRGYDLIAGAVNKGGQLIGHLKDGVLKREEYISALLRVQTMDGPVAKLIKRDLFQKFEWETPREITNNEDMLMLIGLATCVDKVFLTSDIVCYNYITRAGSATSRGMAYKYWQQLFAKIESLIKTFLTPGNDVYDAFCEYRLKRIYNNVIVKGEIPSKEDPTLMKLLNESEILCTNKTLADIVSTLKNKRKMYLHYLSMKPTVIRINLLLNMIKKHFFNRNI